MTIERRSTRLAVIAATVAAGLPARGSGAIARTPMAQLIRARLQTAVNVLAQQLPAPSCRS